MEISKRREFPYYTPHLFGVKSSSVSRHVTLLKKTTHPPVFHGPGNVRIQEHNPQESPALVSSFLSCGQKNTL